MGKCFDYIYEHKDYTGDNCIEWPFARNLEGHGRLNYEGNRHLYAHRVMCQLAHGDPPKDKPLAIHKCNNPPCINPNHIRWGNNSENCKDKFRAMHKKLTV